MKIEEIKIIARPELLERPPPAFDTDEAEPGRHGRKTYQ